MHMSKNLKLRWSLKNPPSSVKQFFLYGNQKLKNLILDFFENSQSKNIKDQAYDNYHVDLVSSVSSVLSILLSKT